ncbi:ADP-dependent glucokinase-like protein, partial [Sarcoptes scabiei]
LEEEKNSLVQRDSKLAIGLGVCTDLVVEAVDVLKDFSTTIAKPHGSIESWQDFLELFAYYFKHGAASERYINSKHVFKRLLDLIDQQADRRKKKAIGGNAALMSLRFSREGIQDILLGAQMSPELHKNFPKNIKISGPIIENDDYHIMLEYKTNQKWNQFESPRANRLIVHSDDNNVKLMARTNFFNQLADFRPNLLIITGIHMLDMSPIDFEIRSKAITDLSKDIENFAKSNPSARKHFEMGSYTENRLLDSVVNRIFPTIDSFGMNEQEVANLLSFIKFGNISYATNPFPRVAIVLDEMRELFQLIIANGNDKISRLHVHTLAYQVVMVRIDPKRDRPLWKSSKAAMAKASLTAYRHTCDTETIDTNRAEILLDDSFSTTTKEIPIGDDSSNRLRRIRFDDAVNCWEEILQTNPKIKVQICLSIGIVCTKVVQTGGAGDNISAAGIILQF